jgi:hypothetical protein
MELTGGEKRSTEHSVRARHRRLAARRPGFSPRPFWRSALPAARPPSVDTRFATTIDADQGSEENIASLTNVIRSNPTDPSAYNVRGSAFGRAGRTRRPARFRQGDRAQSPLLRGLCQPRADPSQSPAISAARRKTTTRRSSSIRATIRPISAAANSIAAPVAATRPSTISRRRSSSTRRIRAPISAAALSTRPAASTTSPSTISRPQSRCSRARRNPITAAASPMSR